MLTLPRTLTLTPDQFAEVCAASPEAVLELDADGTLIEMTPTGGITSARNSALLFQLQPWARTTGDWIVFDSSAGFQLPDGSVRSPNASLVRLDRWLALSDAERDGFPPLCPDLVVDMATLTGGLPAEPFPLACRSPFHFYSFLSVPPSPSLAHAHALSPSFACALFQHICVCENKNDHS